MTDAPEPLLTVIARVRRAMPRNPDVMRICEEAERFAQAVNPAPVNTPVNNVNKTQEESRKAYMREYMRKKRQSSK